MGDLAERLSWLPARLDELMAEYKVPGMSVGVLCRGERYWAGAGVTHVDLGHPVVPGTVFQIGSNTKLLTATAAMRAVDRGRLDLDAKVVEYLPGFALAEAGAAERITVRHLLTHTSGIDGDYPGPPGHGFSDDMIARYVAGMADLRLLHEPGARWSYCNAGWVLLGRVLEVVHDLPYVRLMREDVFAPLGMDDTLILPEHIVPRSAAMGHLPDLSDLSPHPAPVYVTAPACAPAGSVPVSTPDDVLTFLLMHLSGGVAADGSRFLSAASVKAMQTPQSDVPQLGHTDAIGLGWMLGHAVDGRRTLGHGGGTLGQISVLEVVPEEELAVISLSNSYTGGPAGVQVMEQVLASLADVRLPARPSPPEPAVELDLSPYAGTYRRAGTTVTVTSSGSCLQVVIDEEPLVPEARTAPPTLELVPVDATTFVSEGGALVRFFDPADDGKPAYLFNFRLLRRDGS